MHCSDCKHTSVCMKISSCLTSGCYFSFLLNLQSIDWFIGSRPNMRNKLLQSTNIARYSPNEPSKHSTVYY